MDFEVYIFIVKNISDENLWHMILKAVYDKIQGDPEAQTQRNYDTEND